MSTPEKIFQLVERFEEQYASFYDDSYKEAQLRQEFINPFFKELGWDVDNEQGYASAYKDVIHEDSLEVEGKPREPDYSFRIGGQRKFFVEAKKPSVKIQSDTSPAFQLRRYAWSAKLPLSILTNFDKLAIYESHSKPNKNDSAGTGRKKLFIYKDYLTHWDEIAAIFSRDAILKGAFDRYAETIKGKKGTTEVDDAFLEEIEHWRYLLAHNIADRNKELPVHQLNYSTQMTIDRIIFLRICEDRGIEHENQLHELLKGEQVYERLTKIFQQADTRYNSGLFHFLNEKGQSSNPDSLTLNLTIDDITLKRIIRDLYDPSPYVFKEIPADILGQVYERFLGKVISLTNNHQASIDEKPEVRKIGGVYYTPTYIVNYIVKNTLTKLLENKTPHEIADLKILDPACGSGSFLLGAYQYLLDWHINWYSEHNPEKWARGKEPSIYQVSATYQKPGSGQALSKDWGWKLTTREKKQILLNNIYGVDIDPQAVEVTKLSLLLKVVEDPGQLSLQLERLLPDLSNNIKCGNSLIDYDYFEERLLVDEEERYTINAFNWKDSFRQVFNSGGFDLVIGNPPYRRELDFGELLDEIAQTRFGKKFKSPRMDLWYYFVHRGLEILKIGGLLSFIVNSYWISGTGAEKLITDLRDKTHVDEIFFFGKLKVFKNVSGQHMTFRITKYPKNTGTNIKIVQPDKETTAEPFVNGKGNLLVFTKNKEQLFRNGKVDLMPSSDTLLDKIEIYPPLINFGFVRQGIAENPANINKKTNEKFNNIFTTGEGVFTLRLDELNKLDLSEEEMSLIRPYHDLIDLGRYFISDTPSVYLVYSTKSTCPNINIYPKLHDHLRRFKIIMDERRETKKGSNSWWHLHWPREESIWKSSKIISIQMAERPSFVMSRLPVYVPFSVNVFVPNRTTIESLEYFLGILNSKLLWRWYKHYAKRRGVGLEINGNVLQKSPIRPINFSDSNDKAKHDKMVLLVQRMLELHLLSSRTPHENEIVQREIESIDQSIDYLVYDLYELTEEEINDLEELN